jgi:hypothetical protein
LDVQEFICSKCSVTVSSSDRPSHSSSAQHIANGGSPHVVDDDYVALSDSPVTGDEPPEEITRGMGHTR